ncbi:T6SS phospholipase effector Tle1-like catalytic domain-containing protein [Minwuia sp.]|uniref:T6SS phospholipase effector Tle1-like catalytic domain-containing protein n=1 Tax=Minwuia sp. TaxID=2493630 RepID=UPI003A913C56
MSKNIIILCDGTSNQVSQSRTNILRLYSCLDKKANPVVYYSPGVGTLGADGTFFRSRSELAELWGRITGWGLDTDVKEAYRFIVDHYDHGKEDEDGKRNSDKIIIYGFSRGAYTARVLAGFVYALGLLPPNHMNLLDYAYRAYKRIGEPTGLTEDDGANSPFAEMRLYERKFDTTRPHIHFLGLFDTVASMIEPVKGGVGLKTHAFTDNNWSVAHVRHAVAIDERRTRFQPQLWPLNQVHRPQYWVANSAHPQDAKEVWFKGSHGDIGGGYPEDKSALTKFPLVWMIEESQACGIKFHQGNVSAIAKGQNHIDEPGKYVAPDPCSPINESMNWRWALAEYLPRRKSRHVRTNRKDLGGWFIPRKERRIIPPDPAIHPSVYACEDIHPNDLHPNLPSS